MGFPFPETITYWQVTYPLGQAVYSAGVEAPGRSASRREEIITKDGKGPIVSRLAIYTDAEIEEDYQAAVGAFEGESLDSHLAVAGRVLQVSTVPSGTTTRRVMI